MRKPLWLLLGLATLIVAPAALAQSVGSANLTITVSGTAGNSYAVGQPWTLNLTSSFHGTNFSICAIDNHGVQSCTPWAMTDGNGSWTGTGSFDASTIGSWTEWVQFPSQNVSSNNISFTVSQVAAASGSGGSCASPTTAATLSAYLQTLSGIISGLSPKSATPQVLAGFANLLNAVSQTINALGNCGEGGQLSNNGSVPAPTTIVSSGKSGSKLSPRDIAPGVPTATNGPVTQTFTVGGLPYSVTYSYLADGEVSAAFTYTYPNKHSWTSNPKTSFPLAAQGTQQYVYQGGQVGLAQSNGSVQALVTANDCSNFYGGAGCLENDPDFISLIASIKSNSPTPLTIASGFTFLTPPAVLLSNNFSITTPANAYYLTTSANANVPSHSYYYLDMDANGNLIGVTPVSISTTGVVTTGSEIAILQATLPNRSVSIEAILTQLRAAPDVNSALAIARNAGLTITGGVADSDGDASYLVTTPNGNFVAAIGHYDVNATVGAPTIADYVYNNTIGAAAGVFRCKANIGSGTADVNVFPDGKVYGLADAPSYNVSVDCGQGDAVSCAQTQATVNAAAAAVTSAGGPPVNGNSNATVIVRWIDSVIPSSDPGKIVYANATPIVGVDGTSVCNVNLSTPSLGLKYANEFINGNQGFLTKIITHEIGHCMGLGHASDMASIMWPDATEQGTTFSSDDEALLSALRSDVNIQVACPSGELLGWACSDPNKILLHNTTKNSYSCGSCSSGDLPITDAYGNLSCRSCPSGNVYQQVQVDDSGNVAALNKCDDACTSAGMVNNITGYNCVTSCRPGQVLDEAQNQCECAPDTTYDVDVGQCVSNNTCTSGFISGNTCYATSEGTSTSNICFTLDDGTVQCDCGAGYEQQGDACVLTSDSGGGSALFGYECSSDGSCVYNPNGGTYQDSTCNNQCN